MDKTIYFMQEKLRKLKNQKRFDGAALLYVREHSPALYFEALVHARDKLGKKFKKASKSTMRMIKKG